MASFQSQMGMVHFFAIWCRARYSTFITDSSIGNERRPGLGDFPQRGVEGFNGVSGVEHLTDLQCIVKEHAYPLTVVGQRATDAEVLLVPRSRKLAQCHLGFGQGGAAIDTAQIAGHLPALLPADIMQRMSV